MDFQRVKPTAPRSLGPNQAGVSIPVSMSAPPPAPRPIPITMADSAPQTGFMPGSAPAPAPMPAVVQPIAEPVAPTEQPAEPVKTKKRLRIRLSRLPVLLLVLMIVSIAGVYSWQHNNYARVHSQVASTLSQNDNLKLELADKQKATAALPNLVESNNIGSADLVLFLASNNTGCYKQPDNGKGWYKVTKELAGQSAEIQYGCENTLNLSTPSFVLATKTGSDWKLINPVSHWLAVKNVQYPTCDMIKDNKISKQLEPKCAVQTTVNNLPTIQLQDVTNL